ncbi:MAG: NADH-quinone oxidoreductase subunit L [SAR324 cluster bacterium]|nr:NADH-quinone oxidoreductase subunit L [SAR324 cluster bacterium]
MVGWSFLIILIPLAGFAINILGSRVIPKWLAMLVGVMAVIIPFTIAGGLFFGVGEFLIREHWFNWLETDSWLLEVAYRLDHLSMVMLLIILGIGGLIHIYSVGYMRDREDAGRFFSYMNLFIFFMLVLVLGDNLLVMFIGWEGVGLCSYLLIGFDYHRKAAAIAATKAFVTNRIGDVGFLIAIFILLNNFGTLSFTKLNQVIPNALASGEIGVGLVSLICILLFFAATGKSAQFPLFTWLPDAMEGPTPVSALIHAATMVTSGIYLIVRLWPIFELSELAQSVILYTGAFSALVSALIATKQWDIKKVLAYSTISQLGYMFMALGAGGYGAAMFHLTTHAFFKALLFLVAGSVIVQLHHQQDLRKMGGLKLRLPLAGLIFAIGAWSISGLPFGAGFFSKDELLWQLYLDRGWDVWLLAVLIAFLSAYYTYRLFYLIFYGQSAEHSQKSYPSLVAEPAAMKYVLIVLAAGTVLVGLLGVPHYLDIFHVGNLINLYLAKVVVMPSQLGIDQSMTEILLMSTSLAVAVGGFLLARMRYRKSLPIEKDNGWNRLLVGKFFVDDIYQDYIAKPFSNLVKGLGIAYFEDFFHSAPKWGRRFFLKIGESIGKTGQSGNMQDYALAIGFSMMIGFAIVVILFLTSWLY